MLAARQLAQSGRRPLAARRAGQASPTDPPRHSLLWRVFSTNAVVLAIAVVTLASTPVTVSLPGDLGEALVLSTGFAVMLVANLVLMRRELAPLGRLRRAMHAVDPLRPGQRVDPGARTIEVAQLADEFNAMLDRLEHERRDSARRTQSAQEAERRRLSLELHDEIGQGMTALLLRLDVLSRTATYEQAPMVEAAGEATRECLDRVRGIVRRLRPEALDDLGLASALIQLCDRMSASAGVPISWELSRDFPDLSADAELVVYRVAQESLTNIVRHAGAENVTLTLGRHGADIRLRISDDGHGLARHPLTGDGAGAGAGDGAGPATGTGVRGMRERALTVGGTLEITSGDGHAGPAGRPGHGTTVVLDIPASEIA